tara:strand:- start:1510 stop:2478 length:969 start_codon:yes stop_codon:yes gene_type:complete
MISRNKLIGLKNIVFKCANLQSNERLLLISDKSTYKLMLELKKIARNLTKKITTHNLNNIFIHGNEPPKVTAKAMFNSDVIICLTTMSLAHTEARQKATNRGARYLSLPQYSEKIFRSKSLNVNFDRFKKKANKIKKILDKNNRITVITENGTLMNLDIRDRKANVAPGICFKPGMIASPPDAEVNIAVNEFKSNGIIVVDGSVTCGEIGKLNKPIYLIVKNGIIRNIFGTKSLILKKIFRKQKSLKAKIIGEFGIGLNPKAKVCGIMLIDEGALGTIHFGVGSNSTIGGKNKIPFHLDHVVKKPTIIVNNKIIMKNGKIKV